MRPPNVGEVKGQDASEFLKLEGHEQRLHEQKLADLVQECYGVTRDEANRQVNFEQYH